MIQCDICNNVLDDKVCAISCGHLFHRPCLEDLEELDDTKFCPTCFLKIDMTTALDLYPSVLKVDSLEDEIMHIKSALSDLGFNLDLIEQRIKEWKEKKQTPNERCSGSDCYGKTQFTSIHACLAYPLGHDEDPMEMFQPSLSEYSQNSQFETSYYTSPHYKPESPAHINCAQTTTTTTTGTTVNCSMSFTTMCDSLAYRTILPRRIPEENTNKEVL